MRNLLYTDITRGKKLVVVIGEKKALVLLLSKIVVHTTLGKWLEPTISLRQDNTP